MNNIIALPERSLLEVFVRYDHGLNIYLTLVQADAFLLWMRPWRKAVEAQCWVWTPHTYSLAAGKS